ncbi:CopG family transcriptional regulator [Trueperella pecoris]|uniref:CopG family transcriptional regulator n=1 Tax=Trueperella pecoris TaxID=2733571 RepID=A0A7M1R2G9_9ACTO|nr:CopG family transcriptional regulator [Trueperella pecoris]QOR47904.1 CopG family transcriptional regulator [Trueperella pecoris]
MAEGTPVTEAQIKAWATEAEAGYNVDTLLKRGRGRPGRGAAPSHVIAVRFTPDEISAIDARAKEQNITRSELIRGAVLA